MGMKKLLIFVLFTVVCLPLCASDAEKEKIEVDSLLYYLDDEALTAEVIGGNYDVIKEFLANRNSTLTIPSSITVDGKGYTVTRVGKKAFGGYMTKIQHLNLPETLTSIGDYAFSECRIDSVYIPDGVTEIGSNAFRDNSTLKTVIIGKSIETIGQCAFFFCQLQSVTIGAGSIPLAYEYTFGDYYYESVRMKAMKLWVPAELVSSYQESEEKPWVYFDRSHIVAIGTMWVEPVPVVMPEVTIDETVYTIDKTNQTAEVKDGRSVTSDIISIPETIDVDGVAYTVISIGESAYSTCYKICEVTIPNSVISIGQSAFDDCFEIVTMTIGKGVREIGPGAFHGLNNLKVLYVLGDQIPKTKVYYSEFNEDMFSLLERLYVPAELVEAYKLSELPYWSSVPDDRIFPLGTTDLAELKKESSTNAYYSLDGRKLSRPEKGINIIRTNDGKTRKILR
jgi:hypothetical protein